MFLQIPSSLPYYVPSIYSGKFWIHHIRHFPICALSQSTIHAQTDASHLSILVSLKYKVEWPSLPLAQRRSRRQGTSSIIHSRIHRPSPSQRLLVTPVWARARVSTRQAPHHTALPHLYQILVGPQPRGCIRRSVYDGGALVAVVKVSVETNGEQDPVLANLENIW